MDNKSQIVKHLEMIQGVINRLGHDSFLIKGWSMTLLVGGVVFLARSESQYACIALSFLIPIFGFWVLDGYFLRKERLFIEIYKEVSSQENTNFEMNPKKHEGKPKCGRWSPVFSETLIIFYTIEALFSVGAFFVLTLSNSK